MIKHIFKLIWNKKSKNALMILEIALSFFVLFAGLTYMLFNIEKLNEPMGFETDDKWMIDLDNLHDLDSSQIIKVIDNLERSLLEKEEIENVSFTQYMAPFSGSSSSSQSEEMGFNMWSLFVSCDVGLSDALEMEIKNGRWFEKSDLDAGIEPVVVNSKFIDEYFSGKPMVDSLIQFHRDYKIIGVVEAYKYQGQFEENHPTLFRLKPKYECKDYVILDMKEDTGLNFEEELSSIVSSNINKEGSTILQLSKRRFETGRDKWLLLGSMIFICGFLCLNVALGLFGVLWFNIHKRKSEIGLRQALGAHTSDISKQFISEVLILTLIALGIGVFFAIQIPILKITEFESRFFYKATWIACLAILGLVFICALFPSMQAAKITPANSLQED